MTPSLAPPRVSCVAPSSSGVGGISAVRPRVRDRSIVTRSCRSCLAPRHSNTRQPIVASDRQGISASSASAQGDVLPLELPTRRTLLCDFENIDRKQAAFVGDGGLVPVALSRADQRRIGGHAGCPTRKQGRSAKLENEVAEASSRQMQRIYRTPQENLPFGRAAAAR